MAIVTAPDLSALESLLAKATPGPWRNERTGDEETVMRIIHGRRSAGGSEVCIVTTGSYNDATEAGNAALIAAAVNALPALIARVRELERERGAAGYRAAQAAMNEQASGPVPGGEPDQKAGVASGPLDQHELDCPGVESQYQPAATPSAGSHDSGAASAVMEEVAADPIADLCERLRDNTRNQYGRELDRKEAADALERLRAELERERMRLVACSVAAIQNTRKSARDRITSESWAWSASYGDICRAVDREITERERAERAEAERDTLAAIVRAADAMRTVYATDGCECSNCAKAREYDRARAKVKVTL